MVDGPWARADGASEVRPHVDGVHRGHARQGVNVGDLHASEEADRAVHAATTSDRSLRTKQSSHGSGGVLLSCVITQ